MPRCPVSSFPPVKVSIHRITILKTSMTPVPMLPVSSFPPVKVSIHRITVDQAIKMWRADVIWINFEFPAPEKVPHS